MKILISVKGRFHAFDLAKQLQKRDLLYKLNTTYPSSIVQKWGIEKEYVSNNLFLELLRRYGTYFFGSGSSRKINLYVNRKQAASNSALIKECDVFIGWSASSLEALIEAKKLKKITILERGSSHYNYQMKILTEEHEKFGYRYEPDYGSWQRELLEYELADYISVPSTYVKNTFIKNGTQAQKILVNPYGVDLTAFKKIKKNDNVFRIIFAGNMSIRKGAHYLLEAFFELNLPNSELWHLGSINPQMYPFISKYKHEKIKFLGHQAQDKLYELYSQGSVFVMMSIEEGLAMVQIQAMACGLPLICTENTGGEDLISKNGEEGFVIPIRSTDKLKEKLLFLYENPNTLDDMSSKAKIRVQNGFTWDDYGARYVANLRSIRSL